MLPMRAFNVHSNKQNIALYVGGSIMVKLGHMIVILSVTVVSSGILLSVVSVPRFFVFLRLA